MRVLFKANAYKLSEKNSQCVLTSPTSQEELFGEKMAAVHFHLDVCVAS